MVFENRDRKMQSRRKGTDNSSNRASGILTEVVGKTFTGRCGEAKRKSLKGKSEKTGKRE